MGEVDRQRISAVRTLEALGFSYRDGEGWTLPERAAHWRESDALYELLVERADYLARCHTGRDVAIEFHTIAKTLEAYEAKRWPSGRTARKKG